MTQKPQDPMHQQIILGTTASGTVAIERARRAGTPLVVWRDGKIKEIPPDDPSLYAGTKNSPSIIE